ncbi:MAG: hypothetical protein ACOC0P_02875 [Planctomycetota bacterium]
MTAAGTDRAGGGGVRPRRAAAIPQSTDDLISRPPARPPACLPAQAVRPTMLSLAHSLVRSLARSLNRLLVRSTDRANDRPIDWSTDRLIDWSTDRLVVESRSVD